MNGSQKQNYGKTAVMIHADEHVSQLYHFLFSKSNSLSFPVVNATSVFSNSIQNFKIRLGVLNQKF